MFLFQKHLTKSFLFHQQVLQDQAEMETQWIKSFDIIKLQTKHDHLGPIPVLIYSYCVPAPFSLITHYL